MALRGGNQAVAPHSPFLKAADTNLVGFPSRPGIRAGKRPVVLGLKNYDFNSRIASPAPLRLARRISEYFRDRRTPGAPARKAARTASLTLCGVDLLLFGSVGISISIPGRIRVLVPATPSRARLGSR